MSLTEEAAQNFQALQRSDSRFVMAWLGHKAPFYWLHFESGPEERRLRRVSR
jgi:hypothetical protein